MGAGLGGVRREGVDLVTFRGRGETCPEEIRVNRVQHRSTTCSTRCTIEGVGDRAGKLERRGSEWGALSRILGNGLFTRVAHPAIGSSVFGRPDHFWQAGPPDPGHTVTGSGGNPGAKTPRERPKHELESPDVVSCAYDRPQSHARAGKIH
jgi:hypothetical protein